MALLYSEGIVIAPAYYWLVIASLVLAAIAYVIRTIVVLVRKNDKITENLPAVGANTKRIIKLEERSTESERQISAMWNKVDLWEKSTHDLREEMNRGFDLNNRASDLLLRSILGLAQGKGDEVVEMINAETIRTVAGRSQAAFDRSDARKDETRGIREDINKLRIAMQSLGVKA